MTTEPNGDRMSQSKSPTGAQSNNTDSNVSIVSIDRTPEEKSNAFSVDWRDPADSRGLFDGVKALFG